LKLRIFARNLMPEFLLLAPHDQNVRPSAIAHFKALAKELQVVFADHFSSSWRAGALQQRRHYLMPDWQQPGVFARAIFRWPR